MSTAKLSPEAASAIVMNDGSYASLGVDTWPDHQDAALPFTDWHCL